MFTGRLFNRIGLFPGALASSGRRIGVFIVLCVLSLPPALTRAHHSMTAFDKEQWSTKTGILVALEFVNPHMFLVMDIENEDGEVERWRFEGPGTGYLHNMGFFKEDFEASLNKTMSVESSPARDGSHVGLIRQLTLNSGDTISACPLQC